MPARPSSGGPPGGHVSGAMPTRVCAELSQLASHPKASVENAFDRGVSLGLEKLQCEAFWLGLAHGFSPLGYFSSFATSTLSAFAIFSSVAIDGTLVAASICAM